MKMQFAFFGRVIPARALRVLLATLGTVVTIFFAAVTFYDQMSQSLRTGLAWGVAGILTAAANEFRKAVKEANVGPVRESDSQPTDKHRDEDMNAIVQCSQCGKSCPRAKTIRVDEKLICMKCYI